MGTVSVKQIMLEETCFIPSKLYRTQPSWEGYVEIVYILLIAQVTQKDKTWGFKQDAPAHILIASKDDQIIVFL